MKQWTKNANDASAAAVKKQRLIQYPPIVIIIEPTQGDKLGLGCLVANDAFSDDITTTILNAHTIQIQGVHTPQRGCSSAMRCDDDIPRGGSKGVLQIAEQKDPWMRPVPPDSNSLGGIEVVSAVCGAKNAPLQLSHTQAKLAEWLVRGMPVEADKD